MAGFFIPERKPMSKLAQLREARNAKAREAQELNNRYPADQRMPAAEAIAGHQDFGKRKCGWK